ncbi:MULTISPECIES: hypothetical protein [unclassified Brenneria]|uniref:hypothetical protein n=1 Tax=unclassified Brenneria TaxID=2634434 RepID=UPI001554D883|nr:MULTISPECIES: hypothetical protein [unclassified Brenneria]MBJ7223377.1 hypothetical protein [Brenneria sp. L3-3C-1]MEE3644617.1 hypothetical protein [Brenneria sp. L3_3C_1]MEE3652179.1 hypothetical protein [Brenneria sp. HEZEL_4_2_4]NPD02138.1 hypothetical protein [Brenneria sp. hezel4-2-4]
MTISGIDTHSQNIKPIYPLIASDRVVDNTNSSTAGTDGYSPGNSPPGASTQVTLSTDGEKQSGMAQSRDSLQDLEKQLVSREAQQAKEEREEQARQQADSSQRSLEMINGIPLYGGTLVSMINYPDGSWEAFDAFTGKPVTAEDAGVIGRETADDNRDMFSFYSKGIYNGMTAAEIYEKIQQMMGVESADLAWSRYLNAE